jgi:hypothetical protein
MFRVVSTVLIPGSGNRGYLLDSIRNIRDRDDLSGLHGSLFGSVEPTGPRAWSWVHLSFGNDNFLNSYPPNPLTRNTLFKRINHCNHFNFLSGHVFDAAAVLFMSNDDFKSWFSDPCVQGVILMKNIRAVKRVDMTRLTGQPVKGQPWHDPFS